VTRAAAKRARRERRAGHWYASCRIERPPLSLELRIIGSIERS